MDVQKRKKNYYQNNANSQKKRKQFSLEPGITGFLCTCNFHEKDCVRDAYKLLNQFADEIYGPDIIKDSENDNAEVIKKDDSGCEAKEDNTEDDISIALSKEINELKAEYAKPVAARRFQAVDTGVKNVIFIRSTLPNPLELVTKIVTELDKTKQQRTRFLLRLLPIEVVCKAYMNDIKQKANVMLEKYFAQEPKTFSIVFNRHSNSSIQRDEIIEDLAEIINKMNPGNKADLKNPELAVIVEVVRGVCLMCVAPNYYKFKKYNLLEICNTKEVANTVKKTKAEEDKDTKVNKEEKDTSLPENTKVNEEEKDTSLPENTKLNEEEKDTSLPENTKVNEEEKDTSSPENTKLNEEEKDASLPEKTIENIKESSN